MPMARRRNIALAAAATLLLVSALGAVTRVAASQQPLGPPRPKDGDLPAPAAPGPPQLARYIVVLRGNLDAREREQAAGHVRVRVLADRPGPGASQAPQRGTPEVHHELAGALHGVVATMTPAAAAELQRHPAVELVEPDQRLDMQPVASSSDAAARRTAEGPDPAAGDGAPADADGAPDRGSWALDALCRAHDQHAAANGTGTVCPDPHGGEGVDVYVIDSGVAEVHGLEGRVVHGYSLFNSYDDCVGHGTMVASLVAGSQVGVARAATVVNVRVFGCASGYVTSLVSGLSYVAAAAADSGRPSVATITSSTPNGPSLALNKAVEAAVNAGVVVVVTGGHNGDSCAKSPASEQSALTVSSSTVDGAAAPWAGTGVCVDLFAPGEDIHTVRPNDVSVHVTGSGMAAAAVAGVAAVVRGIDPAATVDEVANAVLCAAASEAVEDVPERTANLLAQVPPTHDLHLAPCEVAVPPVESCDETVCHGRGTCYQGRDYMCSCDCGFFGRTCESDMGLQHLALKGTLTGSTEGGKSYGGHPSAEMYFSIDIPASSESFELSLCSPNTDFDTYVWVLASCPSFDNIGFFSFLNAVAVNDDGLAGGCPVKHPNVWFPPSEIGPAKLSPGRYTIVVEGHGFEEGTFTMTWDAHVPPVDCLVGAWSEWTDCSEPCAGGVRTRQREVLREARFGGTPCPPETQLKVHEACNEQACSNGCVVTEWGAWGDCSVTCGGGFRQRFRAVVTQPQVGHGSCPPLSEEELCLTTPCKDLCAGVECPAAEECFVAGGCDGATGECLPPVPVAGCVPADDECPGDEDKTEPGECGCGAPDTDSDGDGVADCLDACPLSDFKVYPGVCGCSTPDTQSDGDGIPDCDDECPEDADKVSPAACGCGQPDVDSDKDHTADCLDECPHDAAKVAPGVCGCGHADTDADGDGVVDCLDGCPFDASKTEPGACGCYVSDADSDGDGTVDCHDECPADDDKTAYGWCGCGTPETDADSDGHVDCMDDCPADADKFLPGVCGCGVAETDTDGDGVADCDDECPDDASHVGSGVCGCGTTDVDTDGDGVFDCQDACKHDPLKTAPGSCGCGAADTDTDGDGFTDCNDACDADAGKQEPGVCGCGVPDVDTDGDGAPDCVDGCKHDAAKTEPGACGCGISDQDTDGDEVSDCFDGCEADPLKSEPGHCGCGVPEHDSDGDGALDCQDGCPGDALKLAPLTCGCNVPETDSDDDGVADCNDGCAHDAAKSAPGLCGCGVADSDSDGDGSPDCLDGCAADGAKVAPGVCGCGVEDVDTDGDGTLDCREECHEDATKSEPGACGCGVPDTDTDEDGTSDCVDGCSGDAAKIAPGVCGCGVADTDADNDGVADCFDGCPQDALKGAPGVCGCGVADDDSDGDSVPDCNDECPQDPAKTAFGVCGCSITDVDGDGDAVPDCLDGCPRDGTKFVPGLCGCGAPDTDTDGDGAPDCFDGCDHDATKFVPGLCGCGVPEDDTDGDGVLNCKEQCPHDPLKQSRGKCGCGVPDADTDGDGTPDCHDGCPLSPAKSGAGECGCDQEDVDTDGDLVLDCKDLCPHDAAKSAPGVCGCGVRDKDSDGDGTADCNDECTADPAKAGKGACGCGVSDVDTDGDGTPNCHDTCPADPLKLVPGVCGCGTPDTDRDGDGAAACHDVCDEDAAKLLPGVCGCGIADTDTDADGTPDCVDLCPAAPGKIDAGECGCDLADADSDGDGTPDCVDTCPQDPGKVQRGQCGCGVVDTDSDGDGVADCVEPCTTRPCHNGGLCIDGHGSYTCLCRKYYAGQHCETALDPCEGVVCPSAPSECYTSSVCDSSSGEPVCVAPQPRPSGAACDDGSPSTSPDRCALNHCLGATQWSQWGACFSYCGDAGGAARRLRSRLIFSPDVTLQTDFESCVGYTCPATLTTMVLAVDSDLPLLTTGAVTDAVHASVLQALIAVAGDARASNAVYVEAMATVTPVTQAQAVRRLAPTLAAHHATLRVKYATSGSVDAAAVVSTHMQRELLSTGALATALEASSPLPLQVASITVIAVSVQVEALLDDTGAPVLLQGEPDIATRPPGAPPKETDLHKVAVDSGTHGLDTVVNGGDDADGFDVSVVRGTPVVVVVLGGVVVLAVLVAGVAGFALYTRTRRNRGVTQLMRRAPNTVAREAASGAEAVPLKSASDGTGGGGGGGGWSPGGAGAMVAAVPLDAGRGSEWSNAGFGKLVLPSRGPKAPAPMPTRAAAWNRPLVHGTALPPSYSDNGAGAGPDAGPAAHGPHVVSATTTVTALPEPALMPDGTYSYASVGVGWDDVDGGHGAAGAKPRTPRKSPRKRQGGGAGSQHRNPLARRRPSGSRRRTAPAGPPPGLAKAREPAHHTDKTAAPMPSPRQPDAGRFGSSDSVASTNAWGGAEEASPATRGSSAQSQRGRPRTLPRPKSRLSSVLKAVRSIGSPARRRPSRSSSVASVDADVASAHSATDSVEPMSAECVDECASRESGPPAVASAARTRLAPLRVGGRGTSENRRSGQLFNRRPLPPANGPTAAGGR